MSATVLLLISIGLFGLMLIATSGRNSAPGDRSYADERRRQPAEVATAKLVLSESYLNCDVPCRFGARVDQVYQTIEAILIPVDTKVRYRREVRFEDVIELSVQACVLRNTRSKDRPAGITASWGYVRIAPPNGGPVSYLRVELLGDRELLSLRKRYFELMKGAEPAPTSNPRNCQHCPKRTRCPVAASV